MASNCKCCSSPILNSEFVCCSGQCNEMFHIKCVAVNKVMLNAINACPNIHWYCHGCNAGNRNISATIDRINEAIGGLTNSLSKDLVQFVDGFKTQMENFTDTFGSAVVSQISSLVSVSSVAASNNMSADAELPSGHDVPRYEKEPFKSVVISNIGKDVTTDCLQDYLTDKLKIGKDNLSVSLLLPPDRSFEEITFLQFKVTIPEVNYSSVVCPKFWPTNVHVRDFVFKNRKKVTVTKRQFSDSLCSNIDSPMRFN